MKVNVCVDCDRRYSCATDGGTAATCARCYSRRRRGGLKRHPDPERGKRTEAVQFKVTVALLDEIKQAHPDPVERSEWMRQLIREELSLSAMRKEYWRNLLK